MEMPFHSRGFVHDLSAQLFLFAQLGVDVAIDGVQVALCQHFCAQLGFCFQQDRQLARLEHGMQVEYSGQHDQA